VFSYATLVRLTWPLTGRSEEMRLIEAALSDPDLSGIVVSGAADAHVGVLPSPPWAECKAVSTLTEKNMATYLAKHSRLAAFSVAILVALNGLGSPAAAVADPAADVLGLINQQRAQNGCGPVASNPQLSAAAARHANDMLNNGVTGHTGSDGSTPDRRISDVGYTPIGQWREIVYLGWGSGGTPEAAVDWWMHSPGHRAIILTCALQDVGVSAVSASGQMTSAADFAIH
jgi:uncharacterized protein YkwD